MAIPPLSTSRPISLRMTADGYNQFKPQTSQIARPALHHLQTVCVCTWVCVCVCVSEWVSEWECVCVCVCARTHVCLYTCINQNMVSNGCDPLRLSCDPLGFQQPSIQARSAPLKLRVWSTPLVRSDPLKLRVWTPPLVRDWGCKAWVHDSRHNACTASATLYPLIFLSVCRVCLLFMVPKRGINFRVNFTRFA